MALVPLSLNLNLVELGMKSKFSIIIIIIIIIVVFRAYLSVKITKRLTNYNLSIR